MKSISISVPDEWHDKLTREARLISIKEDKTVTHLDLIRRALIKTYQIDQSTKKS